MSKIKIFVSSRIDINSICPKNDIYVPIECGAFFDKNKKKENICIGDNTGDNISHLRQEFSEYTVMYWMWKNYKSDYYGLCHYRRYLSFNDYDLTECNNAKAPFRFGIVDSMSESNMEYAGILDETKIKNEIEKYDITVSYEYNVLDYLPNKEVKIKSVREKWEKYNSAYLSEKDFDLLLNIISKKAPDYYDEALKYMNGKKFRGFNCFVMKKNIFYEMCEFMFPIMFEFNSKVNKSNNNSSYMDRKPSYVGEWLYSIFIEHKKKEGLKIKERQLILFQDTEKEQIISYDKDSIPVVFSATYNNIPYIAASIKSIIENTDKKTKLQFIILHSGKTIDGYSNEYRENSFRLLKTMINDNKNVKLVFHNPTESLGNADIRIYGENSKEEKLYLSLLPWILPKYKKVIYCNEGVIFDCDIKDLYKEKFKAECIKASEDIFNKVCLNGFNLARKDYLNKVLNIEDKKYYSIKTVLFDLETTRKKYAKKEIVDRCCQIIDCSEENIFNSVYHGSIERLHSSWCAFDNMQYEYPVYREYIPKYIVEEREEKNNIYSIKNYNLLTLFPETYSNYIFNKYISLTPFKTNIVKNNEDIINALYEKDHELVLKSNIEKNFNLLFPMGSKRRKIINFISPPNSRRTETIKRVFTRIGAKV